MKLDFSINKMHQGCQQKMFKSTHKNDKRSKKTLTMDPFPSKQNNFIPLSPPSPRNLDFQVLTIKIEAVRLYVNCMKY